MGDVPGVRDTLRYVYAAVPLPFDAGARAVRGIDDMPVRVVEGPADGAGGQERLGALVSDVDREEYSGIESRAGDPGWLAPRAIAHDTVATWAADRTRGAVVPFPMWVLFRDDAAACAALGARHDELRGALAAVRGAREYGVRITADAAAVSAASDRLDPALAALAERARAASPGQGYLLRRKLAEARRDAAREITARVAAESHATLAAESRQSAGAPPQRLARAGAGAAAASPVSEAAYLVEDARYDAFRAALTGLVERYGGAGFRFDFTGPWPPYHFVRRG